MPSLTAAVNQLTELAISVVTGELHERFAAFAEQYLTWPASRGCDERLQLTTRRPPERPS